VSAKKGITQSTKRHK